MEWGVSPGCFWPPSQGQQTCSTWNIIEPDGGQAANLNPWNWASGSPPGHSLVTPLWVSKRVPRGTSLSPMEGPTADFNPWNWASGSTSGVTPVTPHGSTNMFHVEHAIASRDGMKKPVKRGTPGNSSGRVLKRLAQVPFMLPQRKRGKAGEHGHHAQKVRHEGVGPHLRRGAGLFHRLDHLARHLL
jgi:hypothetical protein